MNDTMLTIAEGPANSFVLLTNNQGHTETLRYDYFVRCLAKKLDTQVLDLLHGAVGVVGEAGELIDSVKKTWMYGKPIDRANLVEELGDIRFYMQHIMNVVGISEQEILQHNTDKLAIRYKGLTYTDEAAITRADKVGEETGTKEA